RPATPTPAVTPRMEIAERTTTREARTIPTIRALVMMRAAGTTTRTMTRTTTTTRRGDRERWDAITRTLADLSARSPRACDARDSRARDLASRGPPRDLDRGDDPPRRSQLLSHQRAAPRRHR